MTTTYRVIGKGTTDSNGVAHMDYSTSDGGSTWTDISSSPGYAGTGKGLVDIVSALDNPHVEGSIVSEPYEVWDCIWFDIATTGKKSDAWSNPDNLTITTTDDGTTLSDVSNYYSSTTTLTDDFRIEFEIKTGNGEGRFGLYGTPFSKNVQKNVDEANWMHYRITRQNGVFTLEYSSDGVIWTTTTLIVNGLTTEDCSFKFYNLATDRTLSYRNLKAYKV